MSPILEQIEDEHFFDISSKRHYFFDENVVLHCHHYSVLFTQLADDAKFLNGPKLLIESAEESFFIQLKKYFNANINLSLEEKVKVIEEYFSFMGLGVLEIDYPNMTAIMSSSHIDHSWLIKLHKKTTPVNYIGQGFLSAAFSIISDTDLGTFKVSEIESIVKGDPYSKFVIIKKEA